MQLLTAQGVSLHGKPSTMTVPADAGYGLFRYPRIQQSAIIGQQAVRFGVLHLRPLAGNDGQQPTPVRVPRNDQRLSIYRR